MNEDRNSKQKGVPEKNATVDTDKTDKGCKRSEVKQTYTHHTASRVDVPHGEIGKTEHCEHIFVIDSG